MSLRAAAIAGAALVAALATGCGGSPEPRSPAAPARVDDAAADPDPGRPAPPAREGTIERAELLEVLDAGPGAFLGEVDVEVNLIDDRFAGWEIIRFRNPERFATVDLGPGDVVTSVNGQSLARPEALHELWQELRTADEIVVQGRRDGEPFELRYTVTP